MYQDTSRKCCFKASRKNFPRLLPIFRFYFATFAVIWFGNTTVPIDIDDAGRATPVFGGGAATDVLRSVDGGLQGLGGSSIFCIGGYHECCCDAQRLNTEALRAFWRAAVGHVSVSLSETE